MISDEYFYALNYDRKSPSIYQVRKMKNRATKAEMFTENSHLSLSSTITNFRWWSYPSTYLPGNLEKWEGFSEKFTKCLQIAVWCWWHENLPHLSTENIPVWTRIWRYFLTENEMFSVMPKSAWDILYNIPTIWPPAAPCKVQLFLWGKLLRRVSGRPSAERITLLCGLWFHCHNK